MAPVSTSLTDAVSAMAPTMHHRRALGTSIDELAAMPVVSPPQQHVIQILALTFSVVSVASAILAFYWFVKMRRSFRHE